MKYQLLRPLDAGERSALRASISEMGVLYPVLKDEKGNILDGHHRSEIAAELGVDCPAEVRVGLSEEEKVKLILGANEARRHLSQEERRQRVEAALKANPEQSNRKIAAAVGVSHHTVGDARERTEEIGQIAQFRGTAGRPATGKKSDDSSATRIRRAERDHPDLAERIKNGTMTVSAAYKEMVSRDGPKASGGKPSDERKGIANRLREKAIAEQSPESRRAMEESGDMVQVGHLIDRINRLRFRSCLVKLIDHLNMRLEGFQDAAE